MRENCETYAMSPGDGGRMSLEVAFFELELLGPFRLLAPGGRRVDVSSRKGQALVAMLASSAGGERTRSWLQGQLCVYIMAKVNLILEQYYPERIT